MTKSSTDILNWHARVRNEYGSLDRLKDRFTVRHMLDRCRAWEEEADRAVERLDGKPEEQKALVDDLSFDRNLIIEIEAELAQWLEANGRLH